MNGPVDRLLTLRVCDVMNEKMVLLRGDDSIAHAARVLLEHEISGAPVVDDDGRCVGVISATDFVRFVDESCDAPNLTVADMMAPAVQSISHRASVLEAGQMMCGAHIHRLFVVDGDGRPVGVLTAIDLVSATVKSIEEVTR